MPVDVHEALLGLGPEWLLGIGDRMPGRVHPDERSDELLSLDFSRRTTQVRRVRLSTGEQTGIVRANAQGIDALSYHGDVLFTTNRKLWHATWDGRPATTVAALPGTERLLYPVDDQVVLAKMADLAFVHVDEGRVVRRRTPSSHPFVFRHGGELFIIDEGGAVMVVGPHLKPVKVGAIGPTDYVTMDDKGRCWAHRRRTHESDIEEVASVQFADRAPRELWRRSIPRSEGWLMPTTCGPLVIEGMDPSATLVFSAKEVRTRWLGADPDDDRPCTMTGVDFLCLRLPEHGCFSCSTELDRGKGTGFVARIAPEVLAARRHVIVAGD